jgi:hypothetical protein
MLKQKGWQRDPARHSLAARGVKTKAKFGKKILHLQVHPKNTIVFDAAVWDAAKAPGFIGVTITFPKYEGHEFLDAYDLMMFHVWDDNGVAKIGAMDNMNDEIFDAKSLGKPILELQESDILKYVKWYVEKQLKSDYAPELDWDEMSKSERTKARNLGPMQVTTIVEGAVDIIKRGEVHNP